MWLFCSNMLATVHELKTAEVVLLLVVIKVYRISEVCRYTVHFDVIKRCVLDIAVYVAQSAQICRVKQDLLCG